MMMMLVAGIGFVIGWLCAGWRKNSKLKNEIYDLEKRLVDADAQILQLEHELGKVSPEKTPSKLVPHKLKVS